MYGDDPVWAGKEVFGNARPMPSIDPPPIRMVHPDGMTPLLLPSIEKDLHAPVLCEVLYKASPKFNLVSSYDDQVSNHIRRPLYS